MRRLTALAWLLTIVPLAAGEEGVIRVTARGAVRAFRPDGSRLETREELTERRGRLSPDSKNLAYIHPEGDEGLYVADADGQNARRVTPDKWAAGQFDWSPDGKTIALLARPAAPLGAVATHWQIHTVGPEGRDWKQVAINPDGAGLPKFASNGRLAWLRYYPRSGKLQPSDLVIAADGDAKPIIINTYTCDYAWSPDSETIAVGMSGSIGFVDVATGKQQLVSLPTLDGRLSSHAPFHLTFNPRGDSIACRITFLGGRSVNSPPIFGDDEVFIVPRLGTATWFQPGIEVQRLEWKAK